MVKSLQDKSYLLPLWLSYFTDKQEETRSFHTLVQQTKPLANFAIKPNHKAHKEAQTVVQRCVLCDLEKNFANFAVKLFYKVFKHSFRFVGIFY